MPKYSIKKLYVVILSVFFILVSIIGFICLEINTTKPNNIVSETRSEGLVLIESLNSSVNLYDNAHKKLVANIDINSTIRSITTVNLMNKYDSLSSKEKELILKYPTELYTSYTCANLAAETANKFYYQGLYLGNGDAFRHAYWNALMVQELGVDFAELFATAHESDTPDGKDKQMDLRNNAYGRWDGLEYKDLSKENLAIKIKELVANGQYVRIVFSRIVPTDGTDLKEGY